MRDNNTQIHVHNFTIKCHLVNMCDCSKCQLQVPLLKTPRGTCFCTNIRLWMRSHYL